MSAPRVNLTKVAAAAAQATSTGLGILAIIAPALAGTQNAVATYSDTGTVQETFSEGPAVEFATYFINEAENPCVIVRPTCSTSGFYSNPAIPVTSIASVTNGPPAVCTVSAGHGLATGDMVTISAATGDTAINGTWEVTVLSPTTFSIPTTGSGSYNTGTGQVTFLGVDYIGTGTSAVTPGSAAAIADDYSVLVDVIVGGTIGTGPITLQVSLDNGITFGPPVSLGTATSYTPTVPVTGVSTGVVFNFGAGTLVTGDSFSCNVTGPRMTTGDLTSALAALKASLMSWDLLLVHGETTPSFVTLVDSWVTSFGARGRFPYAFLNTRHEYLPRTPPAEETDAAFQTAMSTLLATSSTNNLTVGTSAADMVSLVSGVTKPMPPSLYIATRLEQMPIGVDAARVSDGPVPNAGLYYPNGAAKWHDENVEPGLDSQTIRVSTLRTFDDRPGVYITNAYVLSGGGSNFVYAQNARVLNAGCAAIWSALTTLLSSGYDRNLKTGLITAAQAADWQARGQAILDEAVAGQVSGAVFLVSTNDINLGNGPATITCTVKVEALGYVKVFTVGAEFANTLS